MKNIKNNKNIFTGREEGGKKDGEWKFMFVYTFICVYIKEEEKKKKENKRGRKKEFVCYRLYIFSSLYYLYNWLFFCIEIFFFSIFSSFFEWKFITPFFPYNGKKKSSYNLKWTKNPIYI